DQGEPVQNGHTEADNVQVDIGTDDIKQEVQDEMKRSGKRTFYTILGGTFVLSAAVLHTGGSSLAPYSFGLGALLFLFAWRSFKERDTGVMGPKYVATRHRIEQWDDPEDDEQVEADVDETNGEFERVDGRDGAPRGFDKDGAKEAQVR
ncbi:MAG: hypothetical protein ACLFSW_06135, partial [Halobacteriales archaeon]